VKVLPRIFRLPFFPLWLAAFALMAPVFLRGQALFWGTPLLQFVPWWTQAWRTLLAGHLPLWNPLVGMGAPLLANYQSALFYPLHWVYLLFYALGGVPALAWVQAPMVAVHLAWAGLGMAFLARRLGMGRLAQGVAGLSFGLSGYLVARAGFLSINAAAAWLPWVILFLTPRSGEAGLTRRRFLVLSLCLTLQLLAGHAQTAWYTLLLAGIWVGFWAWNSSAAHGSLVRRFVLAWKWFALALLLAIALAAIQLLPTAEYLAESQRSAAVDYRFAMNYSFWPWHLLTLLAPGLYGSPVTGDYWGYANYWEDAIYVGLLPFLLALGALWGGLRDRRANKGTARLVGLLFILFLLALLLALGKNTPVFPWLYNHVPSFAMFQAPARYMIWAVFALALLASLGAEHWRRPAGRALYWTRLGTAGAFAVSLGAGLAWFFMGDISPTFIRATALAGMWGLGAGLLSLLAPMRADAEPGSRAANPRFAKLNGTLSRCWPWGVAFFIAADLLIAGWGLNPGGPLDIYRISPSAVRVRQLAGGHRLYISPADEEELKYKRFLRFDTFAPEEDWMNLRAVILPNANILDRVASANNFDPLLPGLYVDWMDRLARAMPPARQGMLDVMDVGVVETIRVNEPLGVVFQPVSGGGRARWLPCAFHVADRRTALQVIGTGGVDLDSQVVVEQGDMALNFPCDSPPGLSSAEVSVRAHDEDPNRLELRLSAPSAGWLLLSDLWYPGWRAEVDGEATPIWRGNNIFRLVQVPAGAHTVVFSYRPATFRLGLALSSAAFLLVIILAWQKRQ